MWNFKLVNVRYGEEIYLKFDINDPRFHFSNKLPYIRPTEPPFDVQKWTDTLDGREYTYNENTHTWINGYDWIEGTYSEGTYHFDFWTMVSPPPRIGYSWDGFNDSRFIPTP